MIVGIFDGIIKKFNDKFPRQAVKKFDKISAVNGKAGTSNEMRRTGSLLLLWPGNDESYPTERNITVSYLFTRCFPHHVLHNPSKLALSLCFLAPLGLYLRISKVKALSVVAEQILIRQWTTFQWCPLPESFPITRNVDDLLQNLSAAWCILSWMLKSYICRSPRLVNCYITVANVRVFFFCDQRFFWCLDQHLLHGERRLNMAKPWIGNLFAIDWGTHTNLELQPI